MTYARCLQTFYPKATQIDPEHEGRLSYVTRMFQDMLYSTKSTNFSQISFFIIDKKWLRGPDEMASRAGWNGFADRSLETADVCWSQIAHKAHLV